MRTNKMLESMELWYEEAYKELKKLDIPDRPLAVMQSLGESHRAGDDPVSAAKEAEKEYYC